MYMCVGVNSKFFARDFQSLGTLEYDNAQWCVHTHAGFEAILHPDLRELWNSNLLSWHRIATIEVGTYSKYLRSFETLKEVALS
jgi:hypothetical protein